MLGNAGGLCQKSSINSEDTLGNPIRSNNNLGVRRSRASVFNSPYPNGVLAWFWTDSVKFLPEGEGFPFLTFPAASARPPTLPVEVELAPFFRLFSFFFRMQKNAEKTEPQKFTFFSIFGAFGSPRRQFLAIFGPKTGPRRLLFRRFFENGDFVKIALPPRK